MIKQRTAFTVHRMRCMGAANKSSRSGGGINYVLRDDLGTIKDGCGVTFIGSFRRALGLGRDEEICHAAGKEVLVRFGVNGQVDSLNGVRI